MKESNYIALPLLAMGVALTAFSFYWLSVNRTPPQQTGPALTADSFEGWVPPTQPQTQTSPSQAQPVSTAPITRVSVPRVGINAPVEVLTLDGAGAMQDPRTPSAVAWYDFSARPGQLGNVVLAGHVDYEKYGPAVFWRLRDLKPGRPGGGGVGRWDCLRLRSRFAELLRCRDSAGEGNHRPDAVRGDHADHVWRQL